MEHAVVSVRRFGAVQHGGVQAALLVRILAGQPAHPQRKPLGVGVDGQLSHVTSKKDLPPRAVLLALVRQAVKLNTEGVKTSVMSGTRSRGPAKPVTVPADFKRALAANKDARDTFGSLSPSHRREYVEWITEARREATRARRLATSVEWLAEGKPRNWKYMK